MRRYFFPFFLLLLLFTGIAQAQIQVNLTLKRRLYMRYEPIEAVVAIRNLSGQDITLSDDGAQTWFNFTILTTDGRPVPSRQLGGYQQEPMVIPANTTMRRKVTLNQLYPLDEFGGYRIRASIYFAPLGQYFQSRNRMVEITNGRTIWRQIVGVPEGDVASDRREMSVLTFRHPKNNYVYAKVMDVDSGAILCNLPLGKLITGMDPQIELDSANHLHILHLTGPKAFIHTEVGLNGDILTQEVYLSTKYRPTLRADKRTGAMRVLGGTLDRGEAGAPGTPGGVSIPKISDRPVTIPKE